MGVNNNYINKQIVKILRMKIGYARVSTSAQDLSLQISALKNNGCEVIFTEKKSAVKERTELDKLFHTLRQGDVLFVWKLDRLGRSLSHLLQMIKKLNDLGVDLVCVNGAIDTSSPSGRLFFHIAGAFAEFERDLIIERTKAGITEAKKRGTLLGRRKGLSQESMKKALAAAELYKGEVLSPIDICKTLEISYSSFYRYLKYLKINLRYNVGRKGKDKQKKS